MNNNHGSISQIKINRSARSKLIACDPAPFYQGELPVPSPEVNIKLLNVNITDEINIDKTMWLIQNIARIENKSARRADEVVRVLVYKMASQDDVLKLS